MSPRRAQRDIHGRRGRAGDPLYQARRSLHTGESLLNDKQKSRLRELFADERHTCVQITWDVYRQLMAAYRDPDRRTGKTALSMLIAKISTGVPQGLEEIARLGRTLHERADDVLASFDHPGTSNGATEVTNGRLEHLRGIALGFRHITNYITRRVLDAGGFIPQLHP